MAQTMEDLKFIGFPTIFTQSIQTITTWKKIFTQITLTLLLPLTITFIAHMELSIRLFDHVERNPYQLFLGALENYQSFNYTTTSSVNWRHYFLFKSISIVTIIFLSVLTTSTFVHAVASIYTGRDVTFNKSIKTIPHVWKRVTVTLIYMFITLFTYCLISSAVIFIFNACFGPIVFYNLVFLAIIILSIFGFIYLIAVCQIACVISVLETSSGLKAMIKSTELMMGKRKTCLTISYILFQFLAGVTSVYMSLVVHDDESLGMVRRVMMGIFCSVLLMLIFLVIMVTETICYLVCKLHHGESVDPLSLSTYLGAYLSDSRPVFRTGEDIQLGRPQNQPVSQV